MLWLELGVLAMLLCVTPVEMASCSCKVEFTDPGVTMHEWGFSVAMGASMKRRGWPGFDFQSPRLRSLLAPLGYGGAVFRFGGTAAQFMKFMENGPAEILNGVESITPFNITGQDILDLNDIVSQAGMKLVYNLNIMQRKLENGADIWDPTNSLEFMDFCIRHGIASNIVFQLGNEPNTLDDKLSVEFTAEMTAADFVTFRGILNSEPYKDHFTSRPLLLGPEVSTGGGLTKFLPVFLSDINNDTVDVITWHQ